MVFPLWRLQSVGEDKNMEYVITVLASAARILDYVIIESVSQG